MEKYDVIVIGAGAAGLAAAQKLTQAGKKIVVLEAIDRIGGRIYTIRERGVVEAGAEFVHGENAHTWRTIQSAGLTTNEWLPSSGKDFEHRYGEGGKIQNLDGELDALWEEAYAYEGPAISVSAFLASRPYPERIRKIVEGRISRLESGLPEELNLSEIARASHIGTEGDRNFWLTDGYDTLTKVLAKDLLIKLNTAVAHITWNDQGVIVETRAGEQFNGSRLLITIPVGVMQQTPPQFTPALPDTFTDALHRIGYGKVSKPTFWLSGSIEPFQILSTNFPINFWQRTFGEETVVVGFTGYRLAEELTNMSEDDACALALDALQDALGSSVRKQVVHQHHFSMLDNEFIQGAYSYPAIGMGNAREEIRRPIENTLFYAGEATNLRGHASTVHGALEEGESAAARILEAL